MKQGYRESRQDHTQDEQGTGDGTDREQAGLRKRVTNRSLTGRQAENAGKYLSLESITNWQRRQGNRGHIYCREAG